MKAARHVRELEAIHERVPAPDGRFEIVVHDQRESTMMRYDARIVLADADGAIVETFGGRLSQTTRSPIWSDDSQWLAFATGAKTSLVYLLWNVPARRFGVVPIGNPYPVIASFAGSRALRLEVDPEQIAAANSNETFGGGRAQFPVRRFRAPEPVEIDLASLDLHPGDSLETLDAIVAPLTPIDLSLIPDGFHPYDGPGLKSTTQKLNGRMLEGHHLEDFAEHGDPVARAWLAELRERAGADYDRWARVSRWLGKRRRPE